MFYIHWKDRCWYHYPRKDVRGLTRWRHVTQRHGTGRTSVLWRKMRFASWPVIREISDIRSKVMFGIYMLNFWEVYIHFRICLEYLSLTSKYAPWVLLTTSLWGTSSILQKTREALVRSAQLGSLASPGRKVGKLGEVAIAIVSKRLPGETTPLNDMQNCGLWSFVYCCTRNSGVFFVLVCFVWGCWRKLNRSCMVKTIMLLFCWRRSTRL